MQDYVVRFSSLNLNDTAKVGGKNASIGEMIHHLSSLGIRVPGGFATTAEAYRIFLAQENLNTQIHQRLQNLPLENLEALAIAGQEIRQWMLDTPFPADFVHQIEMAYQQLADEVAGEFNVAVRSSATIEDSQESSFAGQQETFLNIRGINNILLAIKHVFASLFTDRAIAYRHHRGIAHDDIAMSVGIQQMVRSDVGASGVIFTLDPESGFPDVIFVSATYGLGEVVVQGSVNPDEFYVHKPTLSAGRPAILRRHQGSKVIKMICNMEDGHALHTTKTVEVSPEDSIRFTLSDAEVEMLARHALAIEKHYKMPMDIEWGKDGYSGQLYILQARPETVKSRYLQTNVVERYRLKQHSEILATGRSIGQKIAVGTVKIINHLREMSLVQKGDVLVTDVTDPDWEPVMKRAAAVVTNRGGRTCHAAIIARELGIPAIVGCGNATQILANNQEVTVSCAEGETGTIYQGRLDYEVTISDAKKMPDLPVKIMINIGNPDRAFDFASIPNDGVGLARLEFIINRVIGIHPKAVLQFDNLPSTLKIAIQQRVGGYKYPINFYVEKLTEGIATMAAAFAPKPIFVRFSDFRSNEYAALMGGKMFEPEEENPLVGFRGVARYIDPRFQDCFALECQAIKKVRDDMGLTNVVIMLPFVRTVGEAEQVLSVLANNGLVRTQNGLEIIMMCELPSNALLADEFLQYFDGFSIGSNDLTQLTLGVERDAGLTAHLFNEEDAAVKFLLRRAIAACQRQGKPIGICGQAPSDDMDFAQWLMAEGVDSLSLHPDMVVGTWLYLAKHLS